MGDKPPDGNESLTEREVEILRLIADGLTNQQIADQLYLTLETVKWYNKQSYQKLGVGSRTQAIVRARDLGLFTGAAQGLGNNLPSQAMVFVGREVELADIRARLADPACRLLTLVGPGGIGKTRLTIEAARQQLDGFPGGVYFVPLTSIESPAFIVHAIADAVGLVQTNQQQPLLQIIHFLRQRAVLLVIDNFEHLLEGAPLLAELIAKTKQVKLLVTSRERLHLKDEWLFDVQGLHYPMPEQSKPLSVDVKDYEAAQLFRQTAQRMQPDFSPDASDWIYIAHICQLVGGMPLAIELAASWVRVLPCAEIAREIEQGLDILRTTWRDVPERHRSVQAVLDQSWKLLSETEQNIFSQLTLCSGSIHREAAADIANASLSNLFDLVDKSFLARTKSGRFVVHTLLKQYGNDKLRHSSEGLMPTQLRHCRYYTAYLYGRMCEREAAKHLAEVAEEFDDIQAAWRCAVAQSQISELKMLTAGFLVYYRLHSWYRAGSNAIELYHRALDSFGSDLMDSDHRSTVAGVCESLAHLYKLSGDHDKAMNYYQLALAHTTHTDPIQRGDLCREIGNVFVLLNEHEKARATYTQAETILDHTAQRNAAWWQAWAHIQIERMWLYYWDNCVDDMIELHRRVGELIERYALSTLRIRYRRAIAAMSMRRDSFFNSSDGITASGEALALSLETDNLSEIAESSFTHGFSHLFSDHLDEAEKHLRTARDMAEQSGDLILFARALAFLTVVYRKRGDVERVRECADDGLRVSAEAKMPQYTGMAHAGQAWIAWREGAIAETIRLAQMAIDDLGGLEAAPTVLPFRWLALFPLIGVALQQEDIAKAITWGQHLLLLPQQRLPENLTSLFEEAIAAWQKGNSQVANDLLWQAFRLAHELYFV